MIIQLFLIVWMMENMKIRIYDAPLKSYVDKFIDQVDLCLEETEFDE